MNTRTWVATTFAVAFAVGQDSRPESRVAAHMEPLVLRRPSAEFMAERWPAILAHLRAGGSLVQIGGPPFGDDGQYARRLLIGPAERLAFPVGGRIIAASDWDGPLPAAGDAYALTVRFATVREFPDEDGTAGPRDAVLRPLAHILDADGVPRLAPVVEIDRLRGEFAGGRWIFATGEGPFRVELEDALVARARLGAAELDARPTRAVVAAGETPRFVVRLSAPGAQAVTAAGARVRWTVTRPDGEVRSGGGFPLVGPAGELRGELPLAASDMVGLHRVVVELEDESARPRRVETGFRVRDPDLAARAPKLGVSRDWITKDGAPFPVVGTTYMASDVHRKFLFEPNPALWDRDFAAMRRAGINYVRTGLWTGWSRAMLDAGALDDGVLNALEAFVETAAAHDIVVCFTLFAFRPPTFGGANPYLDPRALAGQKAWVAALGARFGANRRIHYDLVNEPSYAPADRLWTNRPIGDAHERAAWRAFLARRFALEGLAEKEAVARLRLALRDASDDPFAPPAAEDLDYAPIRSESAARKAALFGKFSNEVVAGWAATLRRALKEAAGKDALVTLGQDEGGVARRPAQLLHAHAVDYTALHNWWRNDDLLFSGLASKAEGVPNLVSETGLMRLEGVDGRPWRDPAAAALVLERKCALAFGARGAGVVQWAWDVNPYQPIDNEAVIGLVRVDGTVKPELDVLRRFAAFARKAAPRLADYEPSPVVLVLPHDRVWAGMPRGFDGAKRIVRTLADRFGVAPRCESSAGRGAPFGAGARLSLHPSSEFGDAGPCVDDFMEVAQCAFLTEPVEPERHRLAFGVSGSMFGPGPSLPVARREAWKAADGDAEPIWVEFDDDRAEWLRRSTLARVRPAASALTWIEPLPLEFARDEAPLARVLGDALAAAGVPSSPASVPVAATVLYAADAVLVTVANESPAAQTRVVRVGGSPLEIKVGPLRSRCLLLDRKTLAPIADSDDPP